MRNTYNLHHYTNIHKVLIFHTVFAVFIIGTNTLYEQRKSYLNVLASSLELPFHKTHEIQKPCSIIVSPIKNEAYIEKIIANLCCLVFIVKNALSNCWYNCSKYSAKHVRKNKVVNKREKHLSKKIYKKNKIHNTVVFLAPLSNCKILFAIYSYNTSYHFFL